MAHPDEHRNDGEHDDDMEINPRPWPGDIGEALPGADLPRRWPDGSPPPAPPRQPDRRLDGKDDAPKRMRAKMF